ncbi:unnamed protein product [Linum tenue]|uniref:DUF7815 domain-containing protein n=1 Tax=Linum tenue TaxID=586396 RepID=A0AAV0NPW5_9ROSI|nr:unnamed protein product [Linum tenue]
MEALSIPYDEIRSLQISLRQDSNFSSYNPEDTADSAADLPSAGNSIFELDPSPPELRCKHCSGGLLRGANSIICVFCGREQVNSDAPPQAIKFMATSASKWLLQSLGLDGSELSGQSIEVQQQLNKRSDALETEIPLSKLLDLEIHWPLESERKETGKAALEKTHSQKLRTLDFEGLDLQSFVPEPKAAESVSGFPNDLNFFQEAKVEESVSALHDDELDFFPEPRLEPASAASEDQFMSSRPFPSYENSSQAPTDLSLFESVEPSRTDSKVEEDGGGDDSFAGWETEFQSADASTTQESKSFDPFEVSSSVDISAHLDSVFGGGSEVSKIPETSNINDDWFPGDLLSNSNPGATGQTESQKTDIISPFDLDFIKDDQLPKTTTNNTTVDEGDDYFDDWNGFTSSSGVQPIAGSSSKQDVTHTVNSEIDLIGEGEKSQIVDFGGFPQTDLFSGISNDEKDSKEVDLMWPETSALQRIDIGSARNGDSTEVATEVKTAGEDAVSSENPRLKFEVVEKYMSQMHDLSFMLDNDLSIPQKGATGKQVLNGRGW